MEKTIGIDFGTMFSSVAVIKDCEPVIVSNSRGKRATPSIVAFPESGMPLAGEEAREMAVRHPKRTVNAVVRKLGTDFVITIDGVPYTAQETAAILLQKLKRDAEAYLGTTVHEAVIAVPASFSIRQRRAAADAARLAGLNPLRIIDDATAAALAYSFGDDVASDTSQKILAFDLGAGTLSVSLLESGDGVIEVLAKGGNDRLGGSDFDQRIADWAAAEVRTSTGIDLTADSKTIRRVKDAAAEAKEVLSEEPSANIIVPLKPDAAEGLRHLDLSLTRGTFDDLTRDLVEKAAIALTATIVDADVGSSQIDNVILTGGSSRIPAVHKMVARITGKEPVEIFDSGEYVAMGAAIQAGLMSGDIKDILLLDVTPFVYSIETAGNVFTKLIDPNTTVPAKKSLTFTTVSDGQTCLDLHLLASISDKAGHNETLGRFRITGIAPAPSGTPRIEVVLDLDSNGTPRLHAKDLSTSAVLAVAEYAHSGAAFDTCLPVLASERVQEPGQDSDNKDSAKKDPTPEPEVPDDGTEKAILAVLPVLDSLDRAIVTPCTDSAFAQGIRMIHNQMAAALESLGVTKIPTNGSFDPARHHAVMTTEQANLQSGRISETVRNGYMLGDKVIRPAQVKDNK